MVPTDLVRNTLREKLGEIIPDGGDESESMFTNAQLDAMLTRADSLDHAILDGWETKMAHWANLVTVVDGASSRELTALMDHAEKMIKYYGGKVSLGPEAINSRTRIGKIVRNY